MDQVRFGAEQSVLRTEGVRIDRKDRRSWRLTSWVRLDRPVQDVFEFFGDARNLNLITPPWLHFKIKTPMPVRMERGARIVYNLRLRGFPIAWRTEITAWEPCRRFVDEQRHGPYRQWVHEHVFEAAGDSTWCGDQVDYIPPGGALINRLIVAPDVLAIFRYRFDIMKKLFS